MYEYTRRYGNRYPRPLAESIHQADKNKANGLPSGTSSAGLTGGWRRPTVAKAAGGPWGSINPSAHKNVIILPEPVVSAFKNVKFIAKPKKSVNKRRR